MFCMWRCHCLIPYLHIYMYTGETLVRERGVSENLETLRRDLANEEVKSQHLLAMKRAFVRYVSHEIRTPLNIVTMGLKLLENNISRTNPTRPIAEHITSPTDTEYEFDYVFSEGGQDNNCDDIADSVLSMVQEMRDSSETAVSILNDLLMYEKIESNMLSVEPTRVHLLDVVEDTVKMFKIQARLSEINYSWNLRNLTSAYVSVDVNKIGQVLRNLISNALKVSSCTEYYYSHAY